MSNSKDTVFWMNRNGVKMEPALGVAGVKRGNVVVWPPGLIVRAAHEGVGLSSSWFAIAERVGVEIRYASAATELMVDQRGRVVGVKVRDDDGIHEITAKAIVLGCGGFEANVQMRTQHIGPLVGAAKVRGTPHNQGDGLRMALAIGALPWGQWSGCHATPISADWGEFAPRALTDRSNRLSYLYGVMLNRQGLRFVDEGEDTNLLYLCQVRPRDPGATRRQGVADLRPEGDPPAGAALFHQQAAHRRHAGGTGRAARYRRQEDRR